MLRVPRAQLQPRMARRGVGHTAPPPRAPCARPAPRGRRAPHGGHPGPPHGQGGHRAGGARRRASRGRPVTGAAPRRHPHPGDGRRGHRPHRLAPGAARRGGPPGGRGLRPGQTQDPPRLGRRPGAGGAGLLPRPGPPGGRQRHLPPGRRGPPVGPRRGRPPVPRTAAASRRPGRPPRLGGENDDPDLPGRVDHFGRRRGERHRPRRLRGRQYQTGPGGRLPGGGTHPRPVCVARHPGVVRRHAGDRRGPHRQSRPGRAPEFSLPGDLSASDRFYRDDITEPVVLAPDGTIAVPDGPGTGAVLRFDVLDGATIASWWLASG